MTDEIKGSLIGAGAGALSTGGNIISTLLANKANRSLAEYSYDQQKQMIREQNEYNSPKSQMERYLEAGLNPNLIYGDGSSMSGNQQGIAKYEAPTMLAPRLSPSEDLARFAQIAINQAMSKADLDLKHQQFENLKEQQFAIRAQRHAQDIDNMYKSVLYGFDPGLVKQVGDEDLVKNSLGYHRQASELQTVEALTALREANKAYYNVQESIGNLKRDQLDYYNKNIQPLMKEIMEKRSEGLDYSNEINRLQMNFFKADKIMGYTHQTLNDIASFIKLFLPGGAVGSLPSGHMNTPYSPGAGWPSGNNFPSESYIPGL